MQSAITPFRIDIAAEELADLRSRLARSRLPTTLPGQGWRYGTESGYMRSLLAYWLEHYDWRAEEAVLNRYPHFMADIDGRKLHFLHVRSAHAHALPLVLTHGWPGSIHEFYKVIDPLVAPERHGGDPADAFHVICPSLTGYGWSEPLLEPGVDIRVVAERQVQLMAALGYDRYGVQGGDWGSLASTYMALAAPEKIIGVHLNMISAPSTDDPEEAKARGVVTGYSAVTRAYAFEHKGYAVIQSLKPDQLAYALNDSPLGLAAWIIQCFHAWGDIGEDIESRFDKNFLITNALIYWFTRSMPAAIRLYYETRRAKRFGPPDRYVATPTGVALFKDVSYPKREWAERCYNIVHWHEYQSGGHFAAVEEPVALVADIRKFFRTLR